MRATSTGTYLDGRARLGIKFGLEAMRALVLELGHPERAYPALLIAGTNPLMDDKFDPHTHKRYCYIVDKRNPKRLHDKPFDFKRYLAGGCEPYDDHDDGESSE